MDRNIVATALQAVCRTFDSEPTASAALLRRCIEPDHLARYGADELLWIAQEVERLAQLDPILVEEIYGAAFAHEEASEDTTLLSNERLRAFTSTRRQDYELGLRGLAQAYPTFLEGAPGPATRALIDVLNNYVARQHPASAAELTAEHFDLDGRSARVVANYSSYWEETGLISRDMPLEMLTAFDQHLRLISGDPSKADVRKEILDAIVEHNQLAIVWKYLLHCGSAAPSTMGTELRSLAWAKPILIGVDTSMAAGHYLVSVFGLLSIEERRRVEETILALPDTVGERQQEYARFVRDRLIGCLPPEQIVTEPARERLRELDAVGGPPPNDPMVNWSEPRFGPFGEEEYLALNGVHVETEPNRAIRAVEQPVKDFVKGHQNAAPTAREADDIAAALRAMYELLAEDAPDGVDPQQTGYAWDQLADACRCICCGDTFSCSTAIGVFVRQVLLEAAQHPDPADNDPVGAQFEEMPSWSRPAVRIVAAQGLMTLARHPECVTEDLLDAIRTLSRDDVPSVRLQIGSDLNGLANTSEAAMWDLIEQFCRGESSRGVLQLLLTGPLPRVADLDPERIASLVKIVFDRVTDGPGARKVRTHCAALFAHLYLVWDVDLCRDVVFQMARNPRDYNDEVHRLLHLLRTALICGPVEPQDAKKDAIRQRAFALMEHIVRSSRETLQALEQSERDAPFDMWPPEKQAQVRQLTGVLESLASELFFASRAFNDQRDGDARERVPNLPTRQRFLREAGTIFDVLATFPSPRVIHELLKTFEFLISADPAGVFLRIGRLVEAGQTSGYQYESAAVDLIVAVIKRYLAEYRFVLQQDDECQRLLTTILDTFIRAGWPAVTQLTYRIGDIYR